MHKFEDKNKGFYNNIKTTPGQRKGALLTIVSLIIFFLITYFNWNFYAIDMICIICIILGIARWLNFITEIFPDHIND